MSRIKSSEKWVYHCGSVNGSASIEHDEKSDSFSVEGGVTYKDQTDSGTSYSFDLKGSESVDQDGNVNSRIEASGTWSW